MELLEEMKLLRDKLTELCCDCSDMKDLLVVLSRGGVAEDDKVKMEMQGTIDMLSKMQELINDKCWDISNDLENLIKKEESIGNDKPDEEELDEEEKCLRLINAQDNEREKIIPNTELVNEIKGLMFALDHLLNAVEDKEIHIHP